MSRVRRIVATAVAVCGLLVPATAAAVSLQPIGTFAAPVYVTSDPGDPDRLFVVEQDGRIQRIENGATSQFLDIDSLVLSAEENPSGGEQGLLSMAFAPDYAHSGLIYVDYTDNESNLQISELDADAGEPLADTLRPVLTIPHPRPNHNGGQLKFGPDGYLYASTGDGGGAGDPDENAQDTGSLLGKLLRIDPAGDAPGEYTVPPGNPFAGDGSCDDGYCDEIWSWGLRNPWRFSFDRATGALLVGDVGQGAWEEVDRRPAPNAGRGVNFGWGSCEGLHAYEAATDAECLVSPYTPPVFEYGHDGGSCSITGGYVVRDPGIPELAGRYVYGDYCAGEIRSFDPADSFATDRSEGLQPAPGLSSFGEDSCGRLYVANLSGSVSRLIGGSGPTDCSQPEPPPGDGSQPRDRTDTTAPALDLRGKSRRRLGARIGVKVTTNEDSAIALQADGAGAARGKLALRDRHADVGAGESAHIKWRLGKREVSRVRRALHHRGRATIRIAAEATDRSGNRGETASRKVTLR